MNWHWPGIKYTTRSEIYQVDLKSGKRYYNNQFARLGQGQEQGLIIFQDSPELGMVWAILKFLRYR